MIDIRNSNYLLQRSLSRISRRNGNQLAYSSPAWVGNRMKPVDIFPLDMRIHKSKTPAVNKCQYTGYTGGRWWNWYFPSTLQILQHKLHCLISPQTNAQFPFCFYSSAGMFLKHLCDYTSLLTWFSGASKNQGLVLTGWVAGKETTVSSSVLLTCDPVRPNFLLSGQCRWPMYLGTLSWSQRPSLNLQPGIWYFQGPTL